MTAEPPIPATEAEPPERTRRSSIGERRISAILRVRLAAAEQQNVALREALGDNSKDLQVLTKALEQVVALLQNSTWEEPSDEREAMAVLDTAMGALLSAAAPAPARETQEGAERG